MPQTVPELKALQAVLSGTSAQGRDRECSVRPLSAASGVRFKSPRPQPRCPARRRGTTMSTRPIGVAVVGAGMAGRAHLNGYRQAATLYGAGLPEVRLVAVADAHEPFARDAGRPRPGGGRAGRGGAGARPRAPAPPRPGPPPAATATSGP